jgi:hypothetical protein
LTDGFSSLGQTDPRLYFKQKSRTGLRRQLEAESTRSTRAKLKPSLFVRIAGKTSGILKPDASLTTKSAKYSGVPLGIKVEPLAIYWFAIHPEGSSETFFEHPAPPNTGFERILFFSMSSFLRSVEEETIELDMPNAIARISWLGRLVETV